MPEDVAAERLYVSIVADATGFRRDLQTKVDAAAAKVRAKITAELDSRRLATEVRTAARAAGDAATVKIKTELDDRRLAVEARAAAKRAATQVKVTTELDARRLGIDTRAEADKAARSAQIKIKAELDSKRLDIDTRAAAKAAGDSATIKVGVSINRVQLEKDLRAALREAAATVRAPTVRVNVAADTTRMRAEVDAARQAQELRPVKLNVDANTLSAGSALRALGQAMYTLNLFPTIASGILAAAGALANLTGALFAVAASASQAVGVLAIVPGLAAAGAQGLGALAIGFLGITKAITAMQNADARQAIGNVGTTKTQVNNADQIKAARQSLADAQVQAAQRVSDAEAQAAKQITSAEDNLKQAQKDEKKAQQDLTKAREQAREELQQLAFDTKDAVLAEQQAEIDLEHARLKLEQSRQSVTMSPLDKRQAELDYQKALQALQEAKDKAADLQKQNDAAQKSGVKGTDTYKKAAQQLADAQTATAKAEQDLAATRKQAAQDVARAQADAARQVANAQRSLQTAMRSTGGAVSGANAALRSAAVAMYNLSPAGRTFANFMVRTVMPRFYQLRDAVQGALLPPLQRGITAALPLFDTIQPRLAQTAAMFGQMGIRAGQLAASPLFRRDVATVMDANNVALGHFGKAGFYLLDALRNLLVVTAPLVIRFSKLAESWAKSIDAATKSGRETGKMAAYFDRAWATAAKLYRIVRDVGIAIFNLGRAARPAGDTLLDSLARSAASLRAWTANPQNQQRIQAFFDGVVPVAKQFGNLLNRVVGLFIKLGSATGGHTFDGLFAVLNAFVTVLNTIDNMPGGGTILSTILLLSSAGLGLGLVSKTLGKILTNLAKFGKYSGATGVLGLLTGGRVGGKRGKTKLGDLADDAARMGTEIDKELPKDKKKSTAIDDIGFMADRTRGRVDDVGGTVRTLGKDAEESAVKSGKLATFFGKFRGVLGSVVGPLGRVGLLLTRIPGVGKIAGLFSGFRLPRLSFGEVKLPGVAGVLKQISAWFSKIKSGVGKLVGKSGGGILGDALTGAVAKGGAKGAAKGGASELEKLGAGALVGAGAGAAAKSAAKGGGKGLLGRLGAGALKGGKFGGIGGLVLGASTGILGSVVGGGKKGVQGAAGGAISGAGTGAALGGMAGGRGALIGGVVGALIGGVTGGGWWKPIGDFFKKLPGRIAGEAKKLPGQIVSLLKGAGDFATKVGKWLLDGLKKLPGLIVKGLGNLLKAATNLVFNTIPSLIGTFLKKAPAKIIDLLLTGLETGFKTIGDTIVAFAWLVDQAAKIAPKVLRKLVGIVPAIARGIGRAASKVPGLFGWLTKQGSSVATRLPGVIWRGVKAIPGLIWRAIKGIGGLFANAWRRISSGASAGLRNVRAVIRRHMGNIGAIFSTYARRFWHYISDAFNRINGYARSGMSAVGRTVSRAWSKVSGYFNSAKNAVVKTAKDIFNSVYSTVSSWMDKSRSKVSDILTKIKSGFSSAKNDIGKIWSGLGSLVAKPVNWIGLNVYNKGIKRVWDMVDDKVNKGHAHLPGYIAFAKGGIYGALPGYTPGRDVYNIPAIGMSGGEAIMRPEWTRAVGPAFVDFFNELARTGGVRAVRQAMQAMATDGVSLGGFASGGIVPRRIATFAGGGIWGAISGGWSKFLGAAKGLFSGGLKQAAGWVLNPIMNALGGAVGSVSDWGAELAKLPPEMVSKFISYIVSALEPKLGGDPHGVVAAAKQFIGQGDDGGPNVNQWTRAWGMPGAPWCAMFVSDMIKRAKATKFYSGYPTALAAGYDSMQHVSSGRAGDLATYNGGGHINIIEKPAGGGGYWTIGGNQNALVQRGVRSPQLILRPSGGYSLGGILANNAKRLFSYEAPRQLDKHETQTPLVQFMRKLSPGVMNTVMKALLDSNVRVQGARDQGAGFLRDRGGPVPPGRHMVDNRTSGYEWVITPEAVNLLGGPQAVTALNSGAASLYRTARAMSASRPAAAAEARTPTNATIQVYPRASQSEEEIGAVAARRLGVMLQ